MDKLPLYIDNNGIRTRIGTVKIEGNDGTMMGEIDPEYVDIFRQKDLFGFSIAEDNVTIIERKDE